MFVTGGDINAKTDIEVIEKLESEKEVKVIIELEDEDLTIGGAEDQYKNYVLKEVDEEELKELEENESVEKILMSKKIQAFLQDSDDIINSTLVHNSQISGLNLTGTNQTVCVIDSGADFTHPDLLGKNKSCVVDCFNKACVEDCSLGDDNGHGTHVSGIVAASGGITGVAPNASLIAVKILNSGGAGSGNDFDLSNAVDWCVAQNSTVITMSLGTVTLYNTDCSATMGSWTESIDAAYAANISVIAATGNSANYTHIASPACIANVTPVGDTYDANGVSGVWSACTDSTTVLDQIVCHANRNALVQLLAPGARINSTEPSNTYGEQGGTSMAAPHVAGAFALINQYLNLTSRTRTPNQIETILNSTGKTLSDASSGFSFTRIETYAAILSLDNVSPSVNLTSPPDNHINASQTHVFNCNATEDLRLKNITLNIWKAVNGTLYTSSTNASSGLTTTLKANVSDMPLGNYKWNCIVYDVNENSNYASSNYSLYIGNLSVTLDSPSNNTYTNQNQTNFTCTSYTSNLFNLTNVTLSLYNSTGSLFYNESKNISGTSNQTTFVYNLTLEDGYLWNCEPYNNASESDSGDNNLTLTFDQTNPTITNVTAGSITTSAATITWTTNENANSSISYGTTTSLGTNSSSASLTRSHSRALSSLSASTTYYYNVTSCDISGNCITNGTNNFTTSAASSDDGGSSGSSSPSGTAISNLSAWTLTKTINKDAFENGTTVLFSKKHRAKLNLDGETHYVGVLEISNSTVKIKVESVPQEATFSVGEEKKFEVTDDNVYDILVRLNAIINGKVNLTIQRISEAITTAEEPEVTVDVVEEAEEAELATETGEPLFSFSNLKIVIYIIIGVFIIIVIFVIARRFKARSEGKPAKKKNNKKKRKNISKSKA